MKKSGESTLKTRPIQVSSARMVSIRVAMIRKSCLYILAYLLLDAC